MSDPSGSTRGDEPTPGGRSRRPAEAEEGSSGRPAGEGHGGDAARHAPAPAPEAPFTQLVGRVTVGVLAVLFGVFAVANAQFVSFNWILGETTAEFSDGGEHLRGGVPLIVLLLGSFAIGAVVGWFATWWRARRTREPSTDPGEGQG